MLFLAQKSTLGTTIFKLMGLRVHEVQLLQVKRQIDIKAIQGL